MRVAWAVFWALCLALTLTRAQSWAQAGVDKTRTTFQVPREAVLMGSEVGQSEWPTRLATPSDEGQFEVLVAKDAVQVLAPACRSKYLVVRMPASVGDDAATTAAVARKRRAYEQMLAAYTAGRPLHFEVFAGPYGKRLPNGRLELTGCNLFFVEPQTSAH